MRNQSLPLNVKAQRQRSFQKNRRLSIANILLALAIVAFLFFFRSHGDSNRKTSFKNVHFHNASDSNYYFAEKMMHLLNESLPFTIFCPFDEKLKNIHSAFRSYDEKKEMVDSYLSHILTYTAVPQRIISKELRKGDQLSLKSLNGESMVVIKDDKNGKLYINGLLCEKVDMEYGSIVVHLINGYPFPLRFYKTIIESDEENDRNYIEGEEYDEDEEGEDEGEERKDDGKDGRKKDGKEERNDKQMKVNNKNDIGDMKNEDDHYKREDMKGKEDYEEEKRKEDEKEEREEKEVEEEEKKVENVENMDNVNENDANEDKEDADEEEKEKEKEKGRRESGNDFASKINGIDENSNSNLNVLSELRGSTISKDGESKGDEEEEEEEEDEDEDVVCSGNGEMVNGECACTLLYQGSNCETSKETSDLGIEPYIGKFTMTKNSLLNPTQILPISKNENKNSKKSNNQDKSHSQSQHNDVVSGMNFKLYEKMEEGFQSLLRNLLPKKDIFLKQNFETCAVVGNSGMLLVRNFGKEIDEHDMIMRFNFAPTIGYEQQVGSSTTIRLSETEAIGFREKNETVIYHLNLRSQKEDLEKILKFKRKFSENGMNVLDLAFSMHVFNVLGLIPSIGYVGIALAMQKCRRVDIYGFFVSERHNFKHHYFDSLTNSNLNLNLNTEDSDKEFVAILQIADADLLWMADPCLYDCRRSISRCSKCLRISPKEIIQKSEWTSLQKEINHQRKLSWMSFKEWEKEEEIEALHIRHNNKYKKQKRLRRRRYSLEQHDDNKNNNSNIVHSYKVNCFHYSKDKVDFEWDRLFRNNELENLSMMQLLSYFRRYNLVVPATKWRMISMIKAHRLFMHDELSKRKVVLYKPGE